MARLLLLSNQMNLEYILESIVSIQYYYKRLHLELDLIFPKSLPKTSILKKKGLFFR